MTDPELQDAARRFILYFDPAVLAYYRQESHRYKVATDNFDGKVCTRSDFYESLSEDGRRGSYVGVDFGFRARSDGSLAIAAWGPDILEKISDAERRKWIPFRISVDDFPAEFDERFALWMRCRVAGDWDVESGPLQRLVENVVELNALTIEAVGLPLFSAEHPADLLFPAAENDASFAAAHAAAYHFIVDGLRKDALERLAARLGIQGNFANDRTLTSLKKIVTDSALHASIFGPLEVVSAGRRLSDHGTRGPSTACAAFDRFSKDIEAVVAALAILKGFLAAALHLDVARCLKRQRALRILPPVDPDRPAELHSIVAADNIVGKTIERIQCGFRKRLAGVHDSEVLIVHFTDGSILGVDTGSNAYNLADGRSGLGAEDFNATFTLAFVPPKQ